MNPFYFGPSGKRLFGVYHPPGSAKARDDGVVLCQPTRDEYEGSHWAFRRLAILLAKEGFPVLRFDYYGTGDSDGDGSQATIGQAEQDVAIAIDELQAAAGVREVSLVGLRIGATLACLAARGRQDVGPVVLWDPLVDGRRHLEELRLRHVDMNVDPDPRRTHEEEEGLFGFPMTAEMRAELEALDLTAVDGAPRRRTLLVTCGAGPDYAAFAQRLKGQHGDVTHEHVSGRKVWEKSGPGSRQIVPDTILRRIVSWQLGAGR